MKLKMLSNLYLSDELYVELDLDRNYLNSYFNYTISRKDVYIEGEEVIYSGRFYYYKTNQRIYLNDIISTHAIDYTQMIPNSTNVVNEVAYVPFSTKGVYQTFIVKVYSGADVLKAYNIGPVLSYYKDVDLPKGKLIDTSSTGFYNVLEQRTNILPRIPKLKSYENLTPGFSNNFFFSVLWIPTTSFLDSSYIENRQIYKMVAKNKSGLTLNYIDYDAGDFVHSENIDGYDLSQLTAADPTEIGICGVHDNSIDSEISYKKVANVDLCPADYYLIWYDRTGAYQCQPFSKKATKTEKFTHNNLVNVIEETRPYEKLVENSWTLNSDWVNDEEYKAFESIFTSPYHYLYDSKLNTGWWVNCSDKQWVQKTHKNQKRLFNLTVNVTANKQERLVY